MLSANARPLVSIALATYNGARYLEALLRSVEAQDYPNIEIVVSDDGSSDGTADLLASRTWSRSVTLLATTGHAGVIGNFARALEACRGRYVALADQDDAWHIDKVSALVARIEALEVRDAGDDNRVPALVFSDIEVVDSTLHPVADSFFALNYNSSACRTLSDFVVANHVPGCAMLFNRELMARAWPIPTDFHMHDWWLMATAAAYGRIDFVARPLMKYRQHDANVVGASSHRTSLARKLTKVLRPDAWRAWLRHIAPPEPAIARTARHVRLIEQRFGTSLAAAPARELALFHQSRRSPLHAARFALRAHTGERLLYSIALIWLAARRTATP